MIAAIAKDRGLGYQNKLLFSLPDDMKRFKKITSGHPIIMGRKTYESIGRPLPNRTNIVISRTPDFAAPGCIVVGTLAEALQQAQETGSTELFIIGGAQLYGQGIGIADKLYLTIVDEKKEADAFFPEYPDFTHVESKEEGVDAGHIYSFHVLTKV
jgi:dihydrofolate reductase